MTSNTDESISFSRIVENLEKLAKRAKNSNHGQHFQRLALNHRILAKLQVDRYQREMSLQHISDAELLMIERGTVFNLSSLQSSIDFFRWSRVSTVQELTDHAHWAAKNNSLLMAMMALRSILEVSGNVILLETDIRQLNEPKNENIARMEWLGAFEYLVDGRLMGRRVDYSLLIRNGLRGPRKFAYKPGAMEADQTAKDLLNGVDALDKRIKGARAAYEFFSEFAHPNLASVWIHYDRTETKIKVLDIHGYAVHHQQRKVGGYFMDTFGSVVSEGIEIVSECIDELLRMDLVLETNGENMARHAKKAIREIVKHNPSAFDSREMCPCSSGKNIQQCCGKLIKASKFGKWTATAPRH